MSIELKGKTVLVTGASSGIGASFCRRLAAEGANLVITARRKERLLDLKATLEKEFKISVEVIAADLASQEGVPAIIDGVKGKQREIYGLINNCGSGWVGHFPAQPHENIALQVSTQISALTQLCRQVLPGMMERRQGFIINVSSLAAFQPVPFFSVYAAVKAYILSFTVALAEEVRSSQVRVFCLCPGATRTEFQKVAHAPLDEKPTGGWQTADQVVECAIKALPGRKSIIVPGMGNWFVTIIAKILGKQSMAAISGAIYDPRKHQLG